MEMTIDPTQASLTIGDDRAATNSIKFTITLKGTGKVLLKLQIPVGENGVLRAAEDANLISVSTDGPQAIPNLNDPPPNTKEWYLGDPQEGVDVKDSTSLTVSIGKLLCRAGETDSKVTVTAATDDNPQNDKVGTLSITKAKPTTAKNPILYFVAEPTSLIGGGKVVTLKWAVVDKQEVTLVLPDGEPIKQATSPYTIKSVSQDSNAQNPTYTLNVDSTHSRQVTVNVLTEGWHSNPITSLGDSAFPSVIFDSGGRPADALYAIFVHAAGTTGRQAVLCKSANGITGWEVVNEAVPQGMESSPGVLLGNRLWLIGGSAVDPDPQRKSTKICFFDLKSSTWGEAVTDDRFEARMGHACVIVDDTTIWIMGGLGKYQCLNDVWSFDTETKQLSRFPNPAEWKPRCMFSAVEFNNMIWVCGGVTSPNGNPLGDMWTIASKSSPSDKTPLHWTPRSGFEGVADAIGTGTAADGDTLFAVFTNRTHLEEQMWAIGTRGITQSSDNWSKKDKDAPSYLIDGPPSTPHSIAVVSFSHRLYLRSLYRDAMHGDEGLRPELFVHVGRGVTA